MSTLFYCMGKDAEEVQSSDSIDRMVSLLNSIYDPLVYVHTTGYMPV